MNDKQTGNISILINNDEVMDVTDSATGHEIDEAIRLHSETMQLLPAHGDDVSHTLDRLTRLADEDVCRKFDLAFRNKNGAAVVSNNADIRRAIYREMVEIFRRVRPDINRDVSITEIRKRIHKQDAAILERIRVDLALPDDLDFALLFKTGTGRKTINKAIKDLFE